MTRLFTDGAEMGDVLIWTEAPIAATAIKRSGSYSYQLASSATPKILIPASGEIYFRFGFHFTDIGNSLCLNWHSDLTTVLGSLALNNGALVLKVGSTTVATSLHPLSVNTWYLLELHVKIADAGGVLQLRINGVLDLDYSGDTKPSTATTISYLGIVRQYGNNYYDDIAVNDVSGSVDNSWCGDGHVIALVPNTNGDLSQLTGSDGNSTDNYLLVDETPSNSDTDYVEGSTVDQKDLYNLSASGLSNVNISRVWGEARSKDTTTAGGLLAITVKTEGVEYDSSDIVLSTSYAVVKGPEYLVNPQTGVAWTIAELDALQVGPKTRS